MDKHNRTSTLVPSSGAGPSTLVPSSGPVLSMDVAGVSNRAVSTSLFKAVLTGEFKKVSFLFDRGVSPHIVNDDGLNLLMVALLIQNPDKRKKMFRILESRYVDTEYTQPQTGRNVLMYACCLGRDDQVTSLLTAGSGCIDVMWRDHSGLTALHHSVLTGNLQMVRSLVHYCRKYGLSVDSPDRGGLTPYLYARRLGHREIAEVLQHEGHCSPNRADYQFINADRWAKIGRDEKERQLRNEATHRSRGSKLNDLRHDSKDSMHLPKTTVDLPKQGPILPTILITHAEPVPPNIPASHHVNHVTWESRVPKYECSRRKHLYLQQVFEVYSEQNSTSFRKSVSKIAKNRQGGDRRRVKISTLAMIRRPIRHWNTVHELN